MSAPENPTAFPFDEKAQDGTHWHSHSGMTLRDYFAGQALAGFTGCNDGDGDVLMGALDTARACYNYADAMLAQRSKP